MFGKNVITGRKEFVDAKGLKVTSIFPTLQGEGPFAGRAAIFLRLTHCNLACTFCDTAFDDGDWIKEDDLAAQLARMYSDFRKDKVSGEQRALFMGLVVTGGEPTLQPNLSRLIDIVNEWEPRFSFIQLESNGILPLKHLPSNVALVVSPKCSQNGWGQPVNYIKPHPFVLDRCVALKFVVEADMSSPYYRVPQWALDWARANHRLVYVSPMNRYLRQPEKRGTDMSSRTADEVISFWTPGLLDNKLNRANHEHAAKICMEEGTVLSLQTHLYASLP